MSTKLQPNPIIHGDLTFAPWITHGEIEQRVSKLAAYLNKRYAGKKVRLITVMRGGKPFADLLVAKMQSLSGGPAQLTTDTIRAKSYVGIDSRELRWLKDLGTPTQPDVHDILVEDIIDSGRTLSHLELVLAERKPASLVTVALLNRPEARAEGIQYEPAIVGFHITSPQAWAIGFGLDLDETYRDEPHIYGKVVDGMLPPPYTIPKLPPA